MHKILRTFMWTISSSLFLFPLSDFCWGQEEKPLTNNVITQETKSDDELKQQVNAFMQRGEVRQAVELMKGAGLSLEIPILSSDAHELGIREASDVSKVVAEFAKGDVIRVVNYSAVGMDHRRSVIPAGKYLYVSHLKRKGSDEWTEVKGVVFANTVVPASVRRSPATYLYPATLHPSPFHLALPELHDYTLPTGLLERLRRELSL